MTVKHSRFVHTGGISADAWGARESGVALAERCALTPGIDCIPFGFLESLKRGILVRFLQPYRAYLEGRGVMLDDAQRDPRWLVRLYDALNSPGDCPELLDALLQVLDLTSDVGHEHLILAAGERFERRADQTMQDLAMEVYLDDPEVFEEARERAAPEPQSYVEFRALNPAPLELSEERISWLTMLLRTCFQRLRRTSCVDLHVHEVGDDVAFVVSHGRPPRSGGVITRQGRAVATFVPVRHDLILFNRKEGRLSVDAQHPIEHQAYRWIWGEALWGNGEHFASPTLYSGDAFVEHGEAVLDPHGFPGLRDIAVASLSAYSPTGGCHDWHEFHPGEGLDSPDGRFFRNHGTITQFALELSLVGGHRLRVEVQVPNRITFFGRVGRDLARAYLRQRGFAFAEPCIR